MENLILPIVTAWLFTGATVDITSFEDTDINKTSSIFQDTDIIETPLGVLNATYYVLQDEKLPYAAMGLPIDLAIRLKRLPVDAVKRGVLKSLDYRGYDSVGVLFVSEYRRFERSVKKNAVPVPDWQKKIQKGQTHYVDKTYYGGKFIALAQLTSTVPGDEPIIRKKLTEILGTSGKLTKDTHDLWTNALNTVAAAPELMGKLILGDFESVSSGMTFPNEVNSFHDFLKYLQDISDYVVSLNITAPKREDSTPVSVSLKSLHDLDKQYPAMEKNLETEQYLMRADNLWEDLLHAYNKTELVLSKEFYTKITKEYGVFFKKIEEKKNVFQDLGFLRANVYQKINAKAYDSAFEIYYRGLDEGTDNYYIALLKIFEDYNVRCRKLFLNPTIGILSVKANEISKKGIIQGGLEECQQECLKDSRCRAVGFDEINKIPLFGGFRQICWIYYRSTATAKIEVPTPPLREMTVRDLDCEFIRSYYI